MVTGYKFQYHEGDWKYKFQPITNKLCDEYGLHITPAEYSKEPKNMARPQWEREQVFSKWIEQDARFCALNAENMEHFIFLLEKQGFVDVEVTKGSGDYGVDILAEKEGVTYAIQCKRYKAPVGVKAIQEAYAGRDYYDRMVGAVMTNQFFTAPAVEAAKKLKILLWDGGYIESMMEE